MANAETSFCGGCGSNTQTWMGCPVCKQIALQKKQLKIQEKIAKDNARFAKEAAQRLQQQQTYYSPPAQTYEQDDNNYEPAPPIPPNTASENLIGIAIVCGMFWLMWQGVMWVYHLIGSIWHSFISIF